MMEIMTQADFLERLRKIGAAPTGKQGNEYRFVIDRHYAGADLSVNLALVNDQPLLNLSVADKVVMYYYGRTNDYAHAWEYCMRILAAKSAADIDLIAEELEQRKINYAQWKG